MTRIMGIDPGLSATGYGVIEAEGSRINHIAHGVIRTKSQDPTGSRLLVLYNELTDIIKQICPHEVGIETIYFTKNIKTVLPVTQARGVIILSFAKQNLNISEYTPIEVKQAVVGKGRADKVQVQNMLMRILGLKKIPTPDHAADALAVALCHSNFSVMKRILHKLGGTGC